MSTDGPVVRIVGGGWVDDTQRAAIVTAVTQMLAAREDSPPRASSAWALAGRLEGVGVTTVRARSGLQRG